LFSETPRDDAEGDAEVPVKPVKPKIPGAVGFGANIMAELKQKQAKRLSVVRSKMAELKQKQARRLSLVRSKRIRGLIYTWGHGHYQNLMTNIFVNGCRNQKGCNYNLKVTFFFVTFKMTFISFLICSRLFFFTDVAPCLNAM